jgi:hypothetical protein
MVQRNIEWHLRPLGARRTPRESPHSRSTLRKTPDQESSGSTWLEHQQQHSHHQHLQSTNTTVEAKGSPPILVKKNTAKLTSPRRPGGTARLLARSSSARPTNTARSRARGSARGGCRTGAKGGNGSMGLVGALRGGASAWRGRRDKDRQIDVAE